MKYTNYVLTSLVVFMPMARAVDFRLLVEFDPSKYTSGSDFCNAWLSNWQVLITFHISTQFLTLP
jgi:hypothetical protein